MGWLTFYVDLIKRANELARHSQQTGMACLSQSCGPRGVWPVLDRRLVIYRRATD
jgi:hypothetical protein